MRSRFCVLLLTLLFSFSLGSAASAAPLAIDDLPSSLDERVTEARFEARYALMNERIEAAIARGQEQRALDTEVRRKELEAQRQQELIEEERRRAEEEAEAERQAQAAQEAEQQAQTEAESEQASPQSEEPAAPVASRSVWDNLADCESGNWQNGGASFETGSARWNWAKPGANSVPPWGTTIHHGGLQFHPGTWSAYKLDGYPQYAYDASREQQIAVAERVLDAQGWGAWPTCARMLGLR